MLARPVPRPRPWTVDVAVVVAGLGLGATVGAALIAESRAQLSSRGGIPIFLGSFTGLVGTYLALLMVLLASRIPAVERVLGQDGLLRWHRRLAPWPLVLIFMHAVLVTYGYAVVANAGIAREMGTLLGAYASMVKATIALLLMALIALVSIRPMRRWMRRETWWRIHLLMYVALALAFAHEIALGPSFVGHPLSRLLWSVAWAATAGVVIVYRIGIPLVRSLRHGLTVDRILPEADGVVSIHCRGRNLERLAISGGQFFEWRFLAKGMWWQAHPFTVSARPRPPYVRLTVKAVGDFSGSLAYLKRGTRVAIEGPYGAFTARHAKQEKVALLAGGIGVTAVRALLEDLPRRSNPVVIMRASRAEDVVFEAEVAELVRHRKGRLETVIGPRHDFPLEELFLDLIPDLDARDVYVCGPEGYVESVRDALDRLGIPDDAIHHEVYRL
jgi:predicted ferric reductase